MNHRNGSRHQQRGPIVKVHGSNIRAFSNLEVRHTNQLLAKPRPSQNRKKIS